MKSKLEELAAKEAELRRINEALDIKKNKIMATDDTAGKPVDKINTGDEDDKSSDNSFD